MAEPSLPIASTSALSFTVSEVKFLTLSTWIVNPLAPITAFNPV